MSGLALKRRFHNPSLRIVTRTGAATRSSAAENVRPRAGLTPSSEKYGADTNSASRRSGSSMPASVTV